jgi:hypothetical protein
MFNEKEREQLIIEAMKGSVYDKTYLNTLSDIDLAKVASWNMLWTNMVNDKTKWEYNRIKQIYEDTFINHKDSIIKNGDIILFENDVLEFNGKISDKESIPCVIFSDVFIDWLEENDIKI